MGKYDPLAVYLLRRRDSEIELSFRDVERIVQGILPKASGLAEWWSPEDTAPQSRAWTSAGFRPDVDLRAERVRFIRQT